MIIAVTILILVSFKDEISGLIDLYSTLQGNIPAYIINSFITATLGSVEFYFDFWIMSKINQQFWMYMGLMTIVNVVGTIFGGYIIYHKQKIKKWIKRKRISKSMKTSWEKRKQHTKENPNVQIQQPIAGTPKNVSPKSSDNISGNDKGI